ncbi:energy transducer TonB [Thalassotalea piscium]
MKKTISIASIASAVTLGLFAFMAFLIGNDQVGIGETPQTVVIDVIELPEETKAEQITRHKFELPKPPMVMPKSQVIQEVTEINTAFTYTPSVINLKSNVADGVTLGSKRDTDARPIVRVNPKYPIEALRNGLQGWVVLAFDINEIGAVINVKIVDSQPKRIFDKAAKQALKKWKYTAKTIDGKQVKQKNFTVQLDFNMEQQT